MQTNMSTVSQAHAGIYCILGRDNSQMLQLNILTVPVFTKLQWKGWQEEVGGPLYLPVVWKTSRPVEVAKLSVTGIHLITCLTARSFQFMSALMKYSQLMQNNGKDALTKIKDSKINLACNICDTLLLWFSMRCHIVNEVTLQKKILHYFS